MTRPALVLDFGGPVLLTPFELVAESPGHRPTLCSTSVARWPRWTSLTRRGRTSRRGGSPSAHYWDERALEWHRQAGHGSDIRAMIAHLYEPPRPALVREQARALVRDAHAEGLKVAILTNDLRAFHTEEWIDGIEVVGDVDVVVDGSVEGHLKPAPRLYELLSERLDVGFADMVFLDDQRPNIRGAEALGIPSVWFDVVGP